VLQRCPQNKVEQTLQELPKDLDETYARMLKNIAQTASSDDVIRLLQCLSMAIRPLRVEELAEVLALDFDGPRAEGAPPELKDLRHLEDRQRDVLSICSSLVTLVDNDDSSIIQFSHFTVKEFLTSDRLSTSKDISQFHIDDEAAHTTLAQACLGTLLRLDGSSGLKEYASQHWVEHAQFGTVSSRIAIGMRRLFDSAEPYFAAWLKLHDIDQVMDDRWWGYRSTADRGSPLYYASLCGFRDLAAHIILEHREQVNAKGGRCHYPLAAALHDRHVDVAELLHQNGAAVDAPLQVASVDGRTDVVQWLLDHGADPDSQQDNRQTPIDLATLNGHPEVVRTLLGRSVRRNAVDGAADNLVHLATFYVSPKEYRKQTKIDLLTHPLTARLQTCDNPTDIFAILRSQPQESSLGHDNLTKSLYQTIIVLHELSSPLGAAVGEHVNSNSDPPYMTSHLISYF
jgi:ankyrin repeat protein